MGKKSRAKDRAYITNTEWQTEWGGYKDRSNLPFKRLPFHCCAIAFTPFDTPCCTADGTVYDIVNAVPYVRKFRRHPVTGEPLELKDLIRLTFHKNPDGEFHCPVLNKVFTDSTHIVAIRPTGNVYCYEAIEELNIKPKFWKDLLDDTPFTRKDIIHIQDPRNLAGKNLVEFDHVKKDLRLKDDADLAAEEAEPGFALKHVSEDVQRVLGKLNTADAAKAFTAGGGGKKAEAERLLAEAKADVKSEPKKDGPDPRLQPPERVQLSATAFKPGASTWNTDDPTQFAPGSRAQREAKKGGMTVVTPAAAVAHGMAAQPEEPAGGGGAAKREVPKPYVTAKFVENNYRTTGAASRSFTSTAVPVVTRNERVMVRVERRPKAKAYVRLHTSLGDLNLQLHADIAPRTVENFLVLAEGGYYTGTVFHRSIKNFMIQGGDPTGTGTGGESIYGPTFRDELDSRLTHEGRGVLSMANAGPHTNGSQFFILYKSARHLDYKHTVFGRVVGGLEVLTAMERVPTGADDRPLQDISITGVTVFTNPYRDEEEAEAKKAEEERKKAEKEAAGPDAEDFGSWFSNPGSAPSRPAAAGNGVGKYLPAAGNARGVGKYLPPSTTKASAEVGDGAVAGADAAPIAKKQKVGPGYGNFDAW